MEKKLQEIIYRNSGIWISEQQKEELLLSSKIGMNPRELLLIYLEIEKQFNVEIDEKYVVEGKFNTYNNILFYLKYAVS